MTHGDDIRAVATLVDALERGGIEVETVSVCGADGESRADLTVRIPETDVPDPLASLGESPEGDPHGVPRADEFPDTQDQGAPEATASGEEPTGKSAAEPESTASPAKSANPEEATEQAESSVDGPVACRVDGCDREFDSTHGMKIHVSKAHGDDEAVPPHRNRDRLATVYEAHDTFAEMRDALDADVTPQTVRRNLVDHGIHHPDDGSRSTHADAVAAADPDGVGGGSDGSPAEGDSGPEPAANGCRSDEGSDTGGTAPPADAPGGDSGGETPTDAAESDPMLDDVAVDEQFPDGFDPETLVAAVQACGTLHEFRSRLDLDRRTARDLLQSLDLLDLVTGRIDDDQAEAVPESEVIARIVRSLEGESADPPSASAGD